MGKSLAEYAAQNPRELPEMEAEAFVTAAEAIAEREERKARADKLKQSIIRQLESGAEPQTILYTAIGCIGLLSNDEKFAEAGRSALDEIYADLSQQSLLTDNAEEEARRLKQKQALHNAKTREALKRQIRANENISRALYAALASVEGE